MPQDFVISIPNSKAKVSRIRQQRDQNNLKLYLTLEKGALKKNDIFFGLTSPLPDLLIALGVKNKQNQSSSPVLTLESFERVFDFIKSIDINLIDQNIANCLLTSLAVLSESLENQTPFPAVLETADFLIKKGAQSQEVINNLSLSEELFQTKIFSQEENFK